LTILVVGAKKQGKSSFINTVLHTLQWAKKYYTRVQILGGRNSESFETRSYISTESGIILVDTPGIQEDNVEKLRELLAEFAQKVDFVVIALAANCDRDDIKLTQAAISSVRKDYAVVITHVDLQYKEADRNMRSLTGTEFQKQCKNLQKTDLLAELGSPRHFFIENYKQENLGEYMFYASTAYTVLLILQQIDAACTTTRHSHLGVLKVDTLKSDPLKSSETTIIKASSPPHLASSSSTLSSSISSSSSFSISTPLGFAASATSSSSSNVEVSSSNVEFKGDSDRASESSKVVIQRQYL